ncbi:MAG: hypothetical protein KAR24_01625 [Candidatus Pacebacteria bacterium]|nr:hypothetical protein [Candidatus Paceibacterota bacterium]
MKEKGGVIIFLMFVVVSIVAFSVVGGDRFSKEHVYIAEDLDVREEIVAEDQKEIPKDEEDVLPINTEEVSQGVAKEPAEVIKEKTQKLFVIEEEDDPEQIEKIETPSKTDTTVDPFLSPPFIVEEKYASNDKDPLLTEEIIFYTNNERTNRGLAPLSTNDMLDQAALLKVNHMFDEQYFEHVASGGEDVMYWTDMTGYEYIIVGENLALGDFDSEEDMVQAWMDSPGHRANILKDTYEEIGVAAGESSFEGDEVWIGVQIFAVPVSACPAIDKELLTLIDTYKIIISSIEKMLDTLYPEVSSVQPTTKEEYDEYIIVIGQYNNLVAQHTKTTEDLQNTIDLYNMQVQEYNTCNSSK